MFFGNLFKSQKPRGLTWVPRFYDPEDDEQYDEMRRRTKINFNERRTSVSRKRGINPFILLAFVVMIGIIIWVALRTQEVTEVSDIQLQTEDGLPATIHDPVAQEQQLYIQRDTVQVNTEPEDRPASSSEVRE
ncbi:hypothetical protein BMS3Bbin04_00879 [bacterium BMS3Bbin04]|nr:hypothetical protein BMS3Bbin04_00879 [bacterium BMS3Bbin04]